MGYAGLGICSSLLLFITLRGVHSVYPIYAVMGSWASRARSTRRPAARSFRSSFPRSIFKARSPGVPRFSRATVIGPAVGGLVYTIARRAAPVYVFAMRRQVRRGVDDAHASFRRASGSRAVNWKTILAGLRYVWREKIVFGSITLDLFAVLFGGAVFLLPAFVRDVLQRWALGTGPAALRAGDRRGSTALLLAHRPARPPRRGEDALVRRRLRRGYDSVRRFAQHNGRDGRAYFGRRLGHGERRRARHVGAARHARRNARPRECGRHGVHRRVERTRRIRIRLHRAVARHGARRRLGRSGALLVTVLCAWLFPELRNADQLVEKEVEQAPVPV